MDKINDKEAFEIIKEKERISFENESFKFLSEKLKRDYAEAISKINTSELFQIKEPIKIKTPFFTKLKNFFKKIVGKKEEEENTINFDEMWENDRR